MKTKAPGIFIAVIAVLLLLPSCKSTQINASAIVNNENRINYYRPFFESAQFKAKIFALTSINSVYKAANNFNANEMFIVNTKNDSLYKLRSGLRLFHSDTKKDVSLLRNNLIPAKAEDIEMFSKLKKFLGDKENTKLVYTSDQNNTKGNLDVYFVYTSDISDKIKQENIPMSNLTDIRELNILDLSTDDK